MLTLELSNFCLIVVSSSSVCLLLFCMWCGCTFSAIFVQQSVTGGVSAWWAGEDRLTEFGFFFTNIMKNASEQNYKTQVYFFFQ